PLGARLLILGCRARPVADLLWRRRGGLRLGPRRRAALDHPRAHGGRTAQHVFRDAVRVRTRLRSAAQLGKLARRHYREDAGCPTVVHGAHRVKYASVGLRASRCYNERRRQCRYEGDTACVAHGRLLNEPAQAMAVPAYTIYAESTG